MDLLNNLLIIFTSVRQIIFSALKGVIMMSILFILILQVNDIIAVNEN